MSEDATTGICLVRQVESGFVDNIVVDDTQKEIIIESAEKYSIYLIDESVCLCEHDETIKLRLAEVREILLQIKDH